MYLCGMTAEGKSMIRDLTFEELAMKMEVLGEKSFRTKQIWEWLWKKSAMDFDAMSNLGKELRLRLQAAFDILPIRIDLEQKSSDGTIKCRFKLFDDHLVEGVLIPSENRMTACISSQVGCNLGCTFCATGFMKTKRNLFPFEIYDQVVALNAIAQKNYQLPLSNIVFMGMGEPLLNYKNVLQGIDRITAEDGLHISPKRITVSTAGIAKMIKKLADDHVKFNLALSLHAADDVKRSKLMPINDANNLRDLVDALKYFVDKTDNMITFEYILFDGINDGMDDARNLVALCHKTGAKVNIIEYNRIKEADFHKSKEEQREKFIAYLESHRIIAKLRRSRGKDIDAACGQLANK